MNRQQEQVNKVAKTYLMYQLLDEHLTEIDKNYIRAIKKEFKSKFNYYKLKIRIKDTLRELKEFSKIDLFGTDTEMTQNVLGAKELLIDTLINGDLEEVAGLANYINEFKNK